MSYRDSQRFRKVYGYYRPIPRPTDTSTLADKDYVDEVVAGIDWKQSVRAASTTNVNLSLAVSSVDNISFADEDRVLIKNQTAAAENGIYIYYSSTGNLTRTLDAAQDTLTGGAATYVEEGTENNGTAWLLSTSDPITVGTTSQTWVLFSTIYPAFIKSGSYAKTTSKTSFSSQYADAIGSNVFFYVSGTIGQTASPQISVFGGDIFVSGSLTANQGLSGSLTKLADGTSYLRAGSNIIISTGSTGAVTISSTASGAGGDGDSAASYLVLSSTGSLSNERVFSVGTGLNGSDAGAGGNYTLGINNAIVATISGSTFTGVTKHNAGLSGSLTKLTDGTSYLVAGSDITIASASNGAVTISSTAAGTPGGNNTYIQFNDGGSFGGDSGLTYNKTSNNLFLSGGALLINALATENSESLYIEQILTNQTDLARAVYVSQTLTGSLTGPAAVGYGLYFNVLGRGGSEGQNGGVLGGIAGTVKHSSPASADLATGIQATAVVSKPDSSNTAGNITGLYGSSMSIGFSAENNFTGSITTAAGQRIYMLGTDVSRTIQNAYGIRVGISGYPIGGVGVTNVYGIDIPAMQSSGIKLGLRTQDPIVIGSSNVVGSEKLRIVGDTRSEGTLTSVGDIMPDADTTYNLGSASTRWANIYTGDLHLRNDRGDYTLIEEEGFLSIRFNKTGQRYKFLLERVPDFDEYY